MTRSSRDSGWGRGPRIVGALLLAVGIGSCFGALPATAAGEGVLPPAAGIPSAGSIALPPLPQVDPSYTDGQAPQDLLSKAIDLSSVGVDDSNVLGAMAATQAKLDADAVAAHQAEAASAAAQRREALARAALRSAQSEYSSMAGALRKAVIYLYTSGPSSLQVNPKAGELAFYAADYAESTLAPYGVLARRAAVAHQQSVALRDVTQEARAAAAASARASKAVTDQQTQLDHLKSELVSISGASTAMLAASHATLASEAGKELLSGSSLQFNPKSPLPAPVSTTTVALTWAFAELGKQYVWGATGPDTFDCSGLTQFVWKAAGVSIPRVAADQYAWTVPVPLSDLLPGDLVFFGTTDIHHVGIYIGNGLMINAPHTGTVVQVSPIWWSDLAGFGRVHYGGTPVPPHAPPAPAQPARSAVIPAAGKVPSQTNAPSGAKPTPGVTTPVRTPPSTGSNGPGTAAPVAAIAPPVTTVTTLPPSVTTTSSPVAVTTGAGSASTTTTLAPAPWTATDPGRP